MFELVIRTNGILQQSKVVSTNHKLMTWYLIQQENNSVMDYQLLFYTGVSPKQKQTCSLDLGMLHFAEMFVCFE